jgi:RNA polymerase sigma-70 factor, ECF subfamily
VRCVCLGVTAQLAHRIPAHAKLPGAVADPSPRSPSRTERRLAAALARQDPDALRSLHAEHGATVLGFLIRVLGDRATAEDVCQQVFMEVWQRGDRFDPRRGSALTWIMASARSRAIDQLRRRIPEPRDPAGALALLEGDHDPAAAVDALLEQWRFAHLLRRLPPEESDVLRRRFYEGRSQTEIAEATGMPLGTVKLRMVQGLRRLREALDAEEAGA